MGVSPVTTFLHPVVAVRADYGIKLVNNTAWYSRPKPSKYSPMFNISNCVHGSQVRYRLLSPENLPLKCNTFTPFPDHISLVVNEIFYAYWWWRD